MVDESNADRIHEVLKALVTVGVEEFEADVLLVVRDDRGKVRFGASEAAGLDAQAIITRCIRKLAGEEHGAAPAMKAFVRTAAEALGSDQLILIVRDGDEIDFAFGSGAADKAHMILSDALTAIGGPRRRR